MFTLTDTTQVACHGTGFQSIAEAKEYAITLRNNYGLCKSFSIGTYKDGKFVEVYNSHKPITSLA